MDYATAVVEFFVEKRGKGSALSAADEQTLLSWEHAGIPVSVVFAGIDAAFERKAEPPTSLTECGRWVKAGFKKWSAGAALEPAWHSGLARRRDESPSETPADDAVEPCPTQQLLAELERRAQDGHEAVRDATAEVARELAALAASGEVELTVLAVVDEAIAELALARLGRDERDVVVRKAEAALQTRTLSAAAWTAARAREIIAALS